MKKEKNMFENVENWIPTNWKFWEQESVQLKSNQRLRFPEFR